MLVLSKKEIPQYSKLLNVLFAIKTPCNRVNTWDFSPLSRGLLSAFFLGFFLGEWEVHVRGAEGTPSPRLLATGSFSVPWFSKGFWRTAWGRQRGERQGDQVVPGPYVFVSYCCPHLSLGLEYCLPQTNRNEFKLGEALILFPTWRGRCSNWAVGIEGMSLGSAFINYFLVDLFLIYLCDLPGRGGRKMLWAHDKIK